MSKLSTFIKNEITKLVNCLLLRENTTTHTKYEAKSQICKLSKNIMCLIADVYIISIVGLRYRQNMTEVFNDMGKD